MRSKKRDNNTEHRTHYVSRSLSSYNPTLMNDQTANQRGKKTERVAGGIIIGIVDRQTLLRSTFIL